MNLGRLLLRFFLFLFFVGPSLPDSAKANERGLNRNANRNVLDRNAAFWQSYFLMFILSQEVKKDTILPIRVSLELIYNNSLKFPKQLKIRYFHLRVMVENTTQNKMNLGQKTRSKRVFRFTTIFLPSRGKWESRATKDSEKQWTRIITIESILLLCLVLSLMRCPRSLRI